MRVRQSIQYVQYLYDSNEDRLPLEKLVKAFRGIQKLSPDHEKSFFNLASYHGEPQNYCNHANVLFPTWHRAYLYKLENALRSIPGCENVTLPFWDETLLDEGDPVVPTIFTNPKFPFDSEEDNPLYSYALQRGIKVGKQHRYSRDIGYQTVRYPLSGLVGTPEDLAATTKHNDLYRSTAERYLSRNVEAWLKGNVEIPSDNPDKDKATPTPDTFSVRARFERCLDAPNYTVFSNTTSAEAWIEKNCVDKDASHYHIPLESPHNAMHLAVGGFYQASVLNANEIRGANGDMGANEVAAYDPIFYFHHAFIDLNLWLWQKKHNKTKAGSLDVIPGFPGTMKEGEAIDMDTPLAPFNRDGSDDFYTSFEITDIESQLGYTYSSSSMDRFLDDKFVSHRKQQQASEAPIVQIKRILEVNRADYAGSFVVRLFAKDTSGNIIEIGREPVLSRWNVDTCGNCQDKLDVEISVAIDEKTHNVIQEGSYWTQIHTSKDVEVIPQASTGDESSFIPDVPSARLGAPMYHAPSHRAPSHRSQPRIVDLF